MSPGSVSSRYSLLSPLIVFVSFLCFSTAFVPAADACSVELSILLAFQEADPVFSDAVRTIDRVLRLKAVPISKGEEVDLSLEDIQPAFDEWEKLKEQYGEEKPPAFFFDRTRWKEHYNWLLTLFSALQRKAQAGDQERFHDTVWAIEGIFLDIYKNRGRIDPRMIYGELNAVKDAEAAEIRESAAKLKAKVDQIVNTMIPADPRERAIGKNTEDISAQLEAFLALPDSELKKKLPAAARIISIHENMILNLRWFEDKGEPAELRWKKIKQDL